VGVKKVEGRQTLFCGVSALFMAMGVAEAGAQDRAVEAEEENVVIVTAQRREQDILDVPLSVTAVGAEEIAARGMVTIEALQYSIPNVAISNENQTVSPRFSVRGIGSLTRNVGFDSGLAVYVDGVFTGRPNSASFDLTDVERIEVLRGPQGTLYGKNTTAGAINVISRQPGDELAYNFQADVGNFDLLRIGADISGPLSDTLGGKLAVFAAQRDGTVLNVFNGNYFNDINTLGGRAGLYWEPSANLEASLVVDAFQDRRARSFPEPVVGSAVAAAPGPRTMNVNLDGNEDRDSGGVALTVEAGLGGGYELTSITGYRMTHTYNQRIDNDDTPANTVTVNNWDEEASHYSQEFRLASPDDGPFSWILGAYYLNQTAETTRPVTIAVFAMNSLATIDTESFSLFGQADWRATDRLTLTVGGRYTSEDKELSNFRQISSFPSYPSFGPLSGSISDDNFSPMASALYEVSEDVNVYATVSRGYKSGGFNADYITNTSQLSFGPESVTNYEAGVRGTAYDGRVRFALAAFHMDYADLQVLSLNSVTSGFFVQNAAEATIDGFEVELEAQLTDSFGIVANVGLLDAVYESFPNGQGGNFTGNRLQDAPEVTANLGLRYEQSIATGGSVFGVLDWSYRGDRFLEANNNRAQSYVPELALLSGRIGYRAPDETWEIALWGQNLTDETTEVYRLRNAFSSNTNATFNDPLFYGVTVRLRN